MKRLDFCFWGVQLRLDVPTAADSAHFQYYFGDYIVSSSALPDVHVMLKSLRDFVDHSYPPSQRGNEKVVMLRYPGQMDWTEYDRYTHQPNRPTCVPPVFLPPWSRDFSVAHGAAVAPPDEDAALVISGESGAGKTTVLLELTRRGHRFVSDDLLIFKEGLLHPFTRPLSLRAATFEQNRHRVTAKSGETQISTPT